MNAVANSRRSSRWGSSGWVTRRKAAARDKLPVLASAAPIHDKEGMVVGGVSEALQAGQRTGRTGRLDLGARREWLASRVLHADETPIPLLDPGGGKTRKAYMWAYARGAYDPEPAVVFDFCLGRGGKYPFEFLKGWSGTLVADLLLLWLDPRIRYDKGAA